VAYRPILRLGFSRASEPVAAPEGTTPQGLARNWGQLYDSIVKGFAVKLLGQLADAGPPPLDVRRGAGGGRGGLGGGRGGALVAVGLGR
jgi:hypothetical protein